MTLSQERPYHLDDRYQATSRRIQLTGVQALVRLPIDQHRIDLARGSDVATFISGYEGSPLAGYDLELARQRDLLEANQVRFVPGLNEEAAATAVQGSQLAGTIDGALHDGVLGIWYGKAPGLDRATDALRHGNLMGADPRGGALVLVGDDPAAKSSSVPCASEVALADLGMPFLAPADSQDVLDLGLHAIELSRASGLWVGLKIVTSVADGSSTVDLAADRPAPALPHGAGRHEPTARLLQPTLGPLERDQVTTRLRIAREYARLNGLNRTVGRGSADTVGIVAAGATWLAVTSALESLGIDQDGLGDSPVRVLKVGMPWPLDVETVREFADGLTEIVVVEEKRSFLEAAIRDALYDLERRPAVTGKQDVDRTPLVPAYGELDVDTIVPRLRRRLVARGVEVAPEPAVVVPGGRRVLPLAGRAPYFCSGCPHNTSTQPGSDSLVGAGIGCHAMVLLMDESQVGRVTGLSQMGGEGLQWIGMAPYVEDQHYVQNLGDGTFDHSGSLAIRAAVAAGVDITYKLLFNSAVAMTGGQRAVGSMDVRQIVDVLLAERVSRIIVTTDDRRRTRAQRLPRGVEVWARDRITEAQQVLESTPGVTVLVHDQECATEKRRRRRRGRDPQPETRVFINERICEGCGDCGQASNCLSVQPVATPLGRKTRIHQSSCNVDLRCLDGDCPSFLTVTGGRRGSGPAVTLGDVDLPLPEPAVSGDRFGVRFAGVGGTGVVTVSQVLATAGLLAGWLVRSLDQTGLAQKGGAVVSDVLLSRTGQAASNRLAEGECDLYLGCDLLVAAAPATLAVTDPARTLAVLSTAVVPTGRMVSDVDAVLPDAGELVDQVVSSVRPGSTELDAVALSTALFGDDQYANMLVLGAGFQSGGIPLPVVALEDAIRLNGVAVDRNLEAFRRGRQLVADPRSLEGLRATPAPDDVPDMSDLTAAVNWRERDLIAYQDPAYAARYTAVVREVEAAEGPLGSTRLTEAVAHHLYKLMAYKDEYEVARLALDPAVEQSLRAELGPDARASWNLHPPVLRALGMRRKLRVGTWFRPAFRVLRASRRLRGTPFDPFGRAQVRRVERELVVEYVAAVRRLLDGLTAESLDRAVEVAALPDLVRGFEDVKLASVERYRARLAELTSASC